MANLAWFTPLPPVRSGIATYSLEIVPRLATTHAIDVFVTSPSATGDDPSLAVYDAHDFLWKHRLRPYDLVVYQVGNAPCHDYMWAYLFRVPGLVVLHDGQLHFARARYLLQHQRAGDYRAEFVANHPTAPPDVAELGVAGLLGNLTYLWPMVELVANRARGVAVHNERLKSELSARVPGAHVRAIRMGVADPWLASEPASEPAAASDEPTRIEQRSRARRRLGLPADATVFAAVGKLTPEKRISEALDALRVVARADTSVRLLLVGESVAHYDVEGEAIRRGVADRLTLAGYVDDDLLTSCLAAADVCLCQRWPTGRETSASWLRCLAAGKPTVVSDLADEVDVPSLDPRTWSTLHTGSALGSEAPQAVCVGIDLLDEAHSLRLAMQRLARDAELREHLGRAARAFWRAHHTLARMASDYLEVIDATLARPQSPPRHTALPAHLTADGTALVARLSAEVGGTPDVLRPSERESPGPR